MRRLPLLLFILLLGSRLYAQDAKAIDDYVPAGFKIIGEYSSDLNGDGRPDTLLMLDVNSSSNAYEDQDDTLSDDSLSKILPYDFTYGARPLILLITQANNKFKQVIRNDNVISSAACCPFAPDGSAFQNITCSKGRFTVEYFYHGGGEHSQVDITFSYSAKLKDWVLEKIETDTVSDTPTDGGYDDEKKETQTAKNFGVILFRSYKSGDAY